MPQIVVTDRDGSSVTLEITPGSSLMEVIRAGGMDGLLALCGGSCACATCHVHVAPEWIGKLPQASEDERELLESSNYNSPVSRLSCQILLSEALDGMVVSIPPEG